MLFRNAIIVLAVLSCLGHEEVRASELSVFEKYPGFAPGIFSQPILQLYVTLSDKVRLGQTDLGERNIVPITGGYFIGEDIRGEVMSGGADWQLERADGVKEIVAQYSIRTDDGQTIMVDNRGISLGQDENRYRLTAPRFHAPAGKYSWLNESLFAGTITSIKQPRAVIIRVYKIHE